jgi:hypothetical protein
MRNIAESTQHRHQERGTEDDIAGVGMTAHGGHDGTITTGVAALWIATQRDEVENRLSCEKIAPARESAATTMGATPPRGSQARTPARVVCTLCACIDGVLLT